MCPKLSKDHYLYLAGKVTDVLAFEEQDVRLCNIQYNAPLYSLLSIGNNITITCRSIAGVNVSFPCEMFCIAKERRRVMTCHLDTQA
jgi:hypothetical protein